MLMTIGLVALVGGGVMAACGWAVLEPYEEIDVMDTSRAREVIPGVRNELGAVLENRMRASANHARARASARQARPYLFGGAALVAMGAVLLAVGGGLRAAERRSGIAPSS